MTKKLLITGLILGIIAIILGAFGAHGLKPKLSQDQMQSFETGIKYQMYHAFFLLILSQLNYISLEQKNIIYYLIVVGVFFFSFSIYFLATNHLSAFFDFKKIGIITPIGGILLILGWIYALFVTIKGQIS